MESLIKQLQKLVSEESESKKQLKMKKDRKRILINKILTISDLINTKGEENSLMELEKCKEEINMLNNEIEVLYETMESYPQEIEKINLELLKESLKIAYGELADNQENLNDVSDEIIKIRERLNFLRLQKEELEKKTESLYSFIHAMIGHEEIEKLDIHYLKNK